MSTHDNPTHDKYLDGEKKLGAAEYEIAENLAETDKALAGAMKKGAQDAKAARPQVKAPPEPRRDR